MRSHLFAPLLALSLVVLSTPVLAQSAGLDAQMPDLLKQDNIPSVAVAEITGGKIVFAKAYGEQSPGVAATDKTLYNLASLSKPITAEVVLRMVADQKLMLDERMSNYYSDPDVADDARTQLLTPRIALTHMTGFPNWRNGKLAYQFTPGTDYGYSGEGYLYLSRFVAAKWKTPFVKLAQRYVLDPAGMKDTSLVRQPWFDGRVAVPTDADGKAMTPQFTDTPLAADLVYTTIGDYARFVVSVMKHQGLDAGLTLERRTPHFDNTKKECGAVPACPDMIGPGLGWETIRVGNQVYMMHTGKDAGVSTFVYWNPDSKSGAVILTNSDNGDKIRLAVLDALAQDKPFVAMLRASS